jgi:hypothetical protein
MVAGDRVMVAGDRVMVAGDRVMVAGDLVMRPAGAMALVGFVGVVAGMTT